MKPHPARAEVKDGPGAARHDPRAAERLLAPERAPERPGATPNGHTWRAGYYHYDGTAYVWVPGSWQPTATELHWPAFTR